MSEHHTATAGSLSPAAESPWVDDADYPHRIENHVKVYLHLEETAAGPRWVVSPVTVDGYPLDGVEDGNYCDYEGHPPGARPDWDRQHRLAKDLYLPTAAELLPILASALGTSVNGPTVDQLRAASDLLAEHAEWRSGRADLSEATGPFFPPAGDWQASDDAGCDLADRAVALLAELTGQTSPVDEPHRLGGGSDVSMMRAVLEAPAAPSGPAETGHIPPPSSTTRSGPAR
ncbi:hypothetical protein J2X46_003936 [Nocardioides sp. BE266]|uniref:hypothetical protein n=1 Tax=Nocardioides sp. BE266 TaxID=2817725 RepID=UPI00285CE2B5|nr:hypothetical protein [Nocardioides sp. BE266]MDR7254934.1 hypothetical protein [Nocardioides sp. BE266]